jgi:hypothetical protein
MNENDFMDRIGFLWLNAFELSSGLLGRLMTSQSGWRVVEGIAVGRVPQQACRRTGAQAGTTRMIFPEMNFHGEAPLHQGWRSHYNRFPPDVVAMVSDAQCVGFKG